MSTLGFMQVKGIALAVTDAARARRFYVETLGFAPILDGGEEIGAQLGEVLIMFKSDWYGSPTEEPNPRITIETEDARATEAALRERSVEIPDPVEDYGGRLIGSFLDSEGNKIWFCSTAKA
ncbi:MAG: VOC family protein [Acidobacteria bacterium]|uniref:VOC family protein n=1 Tax=Candidatus Polarisedimenticola svalbardensis TaxID=2886004 RepID=A0A8J6XSS9_9BACT|nr:VOC family protein [Candidatus Polarisedimenticola svalbardensis]